MTDRTLATQNTSTYTLTDPYVDFPFQNTIQSVPDAFNGTLKRRILPPTHQDPLMNMPVKGQAIRIDPYPSATPIIDDPIPLMTLLRVLHLSRRYSDAQLSHVEEAQKYFIGPSHCTIAVWRQSSFLSRLHRRCCQLHL